MRQQIRPIRQTRSTLTNLLPWSRNRGRATSGEKKGKSQHRKLHEASRNTGIGSAPQVDVTNVKRRAIVPDTERPRQGNGMCRGRCQNGEFMVNSRR